jgi:uncharacterized protein YggE
MSTITVTGAARAAVAPDRALVRVALTHLAPTASAAMAEISRGGEALAALLAELGIARADWATSGVNVSEESEWRNDRSVVVGQRATASASITVRDIAADSDVLGRLLRDVVDTVGGRIDSMSWVVDDENPARLELLAAAAHDARVRADAYAGALGLVVSGVDAVSEHPLGDPTPRPEGVAVMARAMMSDSAPVPVNAGDVDLTARVNVRFTVLPA